MLLISTDLAPLLIVGKVERLPSAQIKQVHKANDGGKASEHQVLIEKPWAGGRAAAWTPLHEDNRPCGPAKSNPQSSSGVQKPDLLQTTGAVSRHHLLCVRALSPTLTQQTHL